MTKTRIWAILTVFGVALVFGIGYVGMLSPQKADVAKANKAAADMDTANQGLRVQIARLNKEESNLPAAQARIAAIEARIPATPALPSYVRWLVAAAASAHVELVAISPTSPVAITVVTPAAAAPAATTSAAPSAAAAPAQAAAPGSALAGIGMSFSVVGNYFAVQAFLKQLEGSPRATVVSSVAIQPGALPQGNASTATPPPPWQTLSAQINATIFMSAVPATPVGALTPPVTSPAGTSAAPAAPAQSTTAPIS
jgi:Tfp pilus assembly protein PilO